MKDLSTPELRKLLAKWRDETQARLDDLCAERDAIEKSHRRWIVEYSLSLCQAEMDWLKQLAQQISPA